MRYLPPSTRHKHKQTITQNTNTQTQTQKHKIPIFFPAQNTKHKHKHTKQKHKINLVLISGIFFPAWRLSKLKLANIWQFLGFYRISICKQISENQCKTYSQVVFVKKKRHKSFMYFGGYFYPFYALSSIFIHFHPLLSIMLSSLQYYALQNKIAFFSKESTL